MSHIAASPGLPFSGLGFQLKPLARKALNRLHKTLMRIYRDMVLRLLRGSERVMGCCPVFGYDLLVLQAREIRGQ